ncbi:MAG TPA: DUF3291 domain-containing protein [Bryobacteraceae bacterium]|nr:DUF3291 domain-containing protein [Bryobacteraceae bacterium]
MNFYHLAQINVARMLAPLDSPVMAGFVSQLQPVNALADRSPGFVWRLQTEGGDATSVQAFEGARILVNMSVWESVEALQSFVYRSGHLNPLRDRAQWFEKPSQPHLALWWIPAGHIPSVQEARERLEFRRTRGDSPMAFSFAKLHPHPDAPAGHPAPLALNLDQRQFVSTANTANGDCGTATRFHYRQQGARVWAMYAGGRVRFGSLVAIGDAQGRLDMRYQHADAAGRFRAGRCTAQPEMLPDGRLRLHEEWQWTNGDRSQGRSMVEEIAV